MLTGANTLLALLPRLLHRHFHLRQISYPFCDFISLYYDILPIDTFGLPI